MASLRSELFDSDRGRPLKLKPEEFRLSMVPIRLSARKPVLEGEGEAGRVGGLDAGGVEGGDVVAMAGLL